MRFDLALAQLSAEDFVRQVLVNDLSARHVVVGEDFRFGHKRAGNLELLTTLGQELDFTVETVQAVLADQERISSTAIRQALAKADFAKARLMLGRAFQMQGHVVKGQQLGRTLGYPTANLRLPAQPSPLQGIFAVYVRIYSAEGTDGWRAGVASLGRRPTVGGEDLLLEVHLFDFAANLYGRRLQVEFVAKLRDELKFEDIATMQLQMQLDEKQAREILAHQERPQRG
jgi:riboflavin kinase/FMN adenylyltransferase